MRYGLLKVLIACLVAAGTIYAGLSIGMARPNTGGGQMTGKMTGQMTGMG